MVEGRRGRVNNRSYLCTSRQPRWWFELDGGYCSTNTKRGIPGCVPEYPSYCCNQITWFSRKCVLVLTEERFSDNYEQDEQNENGTCVSKSSVTAASITASCIFNSRHGHSPFKWLFGTPLRTSYIMCLGVRLIGPMPGKVGNSSFWAAVPVW